MDYSDIIDLPHVEPFNRQRMSMQARAAQFAPFAALTGHSAAIEETARRTEDEVDKKGGSYKTLTGIVQKVDDYTRTLTLESGAKVEIGHIIDID